jgi:hypothetical protein
LRCTIALIGLYFKKAERKHLEAFQEVARAINEKVNLYAQIGRALIAAREAGTDAYQAIEAVLRRIVVPAASSTSLTSTICAAVHSSSVDRPDRFTLK